MLASTPSTLNPLLHNQAGRLCSPSVGVPWEEDTTGGANERQQQTLLWLNSTVPVPDTYKNPHHLGVDIRHGSFSK